MNRSPAEGNRRVLVIDDNRAIHDDFRKILSPASATSAALDATEAALFGATAVVVEQTRFDIDSAYQGQEGVEMVEAALAAGRPYAMAFIDVRMPPGLDGIETTRLIWELDPDLQVVLCTAYSDYSWDEMFDKLGQRDGLLILKKPFDGVEALQLAHALTEKWCLHRQSRQKLEELERRVGERTGELQESHKRLRDLIDGLGPSMFVGLLTPSGVMVECNRPALAAARLTPDDVLGKNLADTYWWSYSRTVQQQLRATIEKAARGEASRYDVRIRVADGALIDVEFCLQPLRDDTGDIVFLVPSGLVITERKRAEMALQDSEERYRALVDWSPEPLSVNRGGKILFVNPAAVKMLGASSAPELIGRSILEFVHSDFHPLVVERMKNQAEVGGVLPMVEERLVKLDGTILDVEIQGTSIIYDGVAATFSSMHDVTERRRADAALQLSEARTKAIVQSSLDCIVMIDHRGRILEFNPAAETIFGYSSGDVLGRELADVVIPPSLREKHRQGMIRYLATGQAKVLGKRIEILAMRSDGREFPVELAITRLGTEEPPTFTGFIRDISERKRVERQLNIQYAISQVLAESSTMAQAIPNMLQVVCEHVGWDESALWSVDSRDRVLRCVDVWSAPSLPLNGFKAASRKTSLARGIGIPGRVWESGRPVWIEDVGELDNFPRAPAAMEAGLHASFAFPILVGGTVTGVIEMFSREVREPDEDALRTFEVLGGQLGEFFQRRQLEDQLFQSQKLETVGTLAGGVAHEFNSILTAIIGQSELLLEALSPEDPLIRNATQIREAADRAAVLTRQLLAYGRKQFLKPESLDLNAVLSGMGGMLRHLMGAAVDTQVTPARNLRAVRADAGQIQQVLMNLAINARDAMPHGGRLTLATANVSFDHDSVDRHPELPPGNYVMLTIADTGVGMSEDVKARAFEPFFTTKGVGEGTGLGLSTCYGIVRQSGGQIGLESQRDYGTTLKIYLPQVDQPSKDAVRRIDASESPRGTETILLVEDDPAFREMAATLLKRLGYSVVTAANGIEALHLIQQGVVEQVDLLLADAAMPRMSGAELSERVLAFDPRSRVLLLQKPYTPSALALSVRTVLDDPASQPAELAPQEPRLTPVAKP